jgi:integrase
MSRPARGPYLEWNKDRGRWYIVYRENGRARERSTGTVDREEANRLLAQFIIDHGVGGRPLGPCDPAQLPIATALAAYGDEQAPSTSDPQRIGYAIAALIPYWGESMVADITKQTCRGYVAYRRKAAGTTRRELGTLRAAINYAKDEGKITWAPSVHMPPKPNGKDRWLRREEAARLLNATRNGHASTRSYLPLFILIGLYTGARKGAILSLRWPQIDLEARRIDFNEPGRARTSKGRARLPIPDRLLTFLRFARQRGSDLGYVVHRDGARVANIKRGFNSACQEAGLLDVTPHTLRHTCGTWLAQRGVPLDKIGGWLGHSDGRTTELYRHHHPDFMEEARQAADRRRA